MMQLSVSSALNYVKRVLDELVSTEEIGMIVDNDSLDLYKLVEGAMVEAVVLSHSAAPAMLLDGKMAGNEEYSIEGDESGAFTITMNIPTLRVVSFQCSDSSHILTSAVQEDSPEGRMQLNEYVRGTYDDPVLVLKKRSAGVHMPIYTYYASRKENATPEFHIEYIPYPSLVEGVVEISEKIEYPTLDMLTSLILGYLSENEKSQFYREKAISSMEG